MVDFCVVGKSIELADRFLDHLDFTSSSRPEQGQSSTRPPTAITGTTARLRYRNHDT